MNINQDPPNPITCGLAFYNGCQKKFLIDSICIHEIRNLKKDLNIALVPKVLENLDPVVKTKLKIYHS